MFEEINSKLWKIIPSEQKDMVFHQNPNAIWEIGREFLGFVDTYYHLSQVIPRDYTIFDFGAGYNAQSWFFTEFAKTYAIEPFNYQGEGAPLFRAPNCEVFRGTTAEFLASHELPAKSFAIVNFVPNWHGEDSIDLIHKHFRNCYTFYPVYE
jgi:hypothetical protein